MAAADGDNDTASMSQKESTALPSIEKLDGTANYNIWKFLMELYLIHENLWEFTSNTPQASDVAGTKRDQRARAKICLSVKPHCLVHVRQAKTAKEAWDSLRAAFEDKGLNNRCRLLSMLVSHKLEKYSTVREYVTAMMTTAQQLRDLGKELDDELIATLLLQGLTDRFQPMKLAMENANVILTTDYVKNKLFQMEDVYQAESSTTVTNALQAKNKCQNFKKKNTKKSSSIKCFICEGPHKAKDCPQNPKSKKEAMTSFAMATSGSGTAAWILDSGASSHMTNRKDWLMDIKILDKKVEVACANGEKVYGEAIGDVVDEESGMTIRDVLYVPGLATSLLSVSTIVSRNLVVVFDKSGFKIMKADKCKVTGEVCHAGIVDSGIYKIKYCSQGSALTSAAESDQLMLWHRRMGHLGMRNLTLLRDKMATGVSFPKTSDQLECKPCLMGKQTKQPFNKKNKVTRANEVLGLVHSDLCGPMEEPSVSKCRYFLTFIDDFTRKTFVYFLKQKSEVFEKFLQFKELAENMCGKKLKIWRTDNGSEFVNKRMDDYLINQGIQHQLSVEYTPEQNGVAERANRTICEKARSMLQDSGLAKRFWAEAVHHAVYLKNRSPTIAVKNKTPEEKWSGKKCDLSNVKTFGCKAFMHIPKQKRRKWDPKSRELIHTGFCDDAKAYRLLDPSTNEILKARDVVFFENQVYLEAKTEEHLQEMFSLTEEENVEKIPEETDIQQSSENEGAEVSREEIPGVEQTQVDEVSREEIRRESVGEDNFEDCESDANMSEEESQNLERRYPLRNRKLKEFPDYVLYEATIGDEISEEPLNIQEALNSKHKEEWRKAILEELDALKKNNTWILVKPEKGQNVIDSKWVLRIKNEVGNKRRFKARLVARGFRQKRGLDYSETFSPVVRHGSLRLLLGLAAEHGLKINHMDVKTAFLNGDLHETVYMTQPEIGKEDYVCLLKKTLYGLKQAPRQWNLKLDEVLNKINFKKLESEPCIYMRRSNNSWTIIAVYVDDLLIFWNNEKELTEIRKQLMKSFDMKDLGKAELVLGMRVQQTTSGIKLDQEAYIEKLLKEFVMEDCKPVSTPLVPGQRLTKPEEEGYIPPTNIPYQKLIGSLMYLAVCTRGDIAYAISFLSQFNNCFKEEHWQAAKRVLRYLKGTKNRGLFYRKTGRQIEGFADADHGGGHDRKSYSGCVFRFAGGAISWESKKQQVIALSSTEAEYVSLTQAAKEAIFLRRLMTEVTGKNNKIVIYCDSQSAIAIAENPVHHNHTKHIDLKYHFIRECLHNGVIDLKYLESKRMPADTLTKALPREKFEWCASWMVK